MKQTHVVFSSPVAGTSPKPREYSPEEQRKIQELEQYARGLLLPESDPYHPWEKRWLDDKGVYARYMRAGKWRLDDGKKRIQGTLMWRREYKPDLIPPEEVRIESETGKIVLNGFDVDGRPVITMRPGKENTDPSPRQIRHLIFCLERAIDFMPPGQDSLVIVVDYNSATIRTNPSISTASKVLTILQNHYVERLGRAIVVNLPFILNFFYKGISPFLDPVTREKMRFNPNLPELIPVEQLGLEFGGKFNYVFEPVSYWEQILAHARIAPDGTRIAPLKPTEQPQEGERPEDATSAIGSGRTTPEMSSGGSSMTSPTVTTPTTEDEFSVPLESTLEKGTKEHGRTDVLSVDIPVG